MRKSGFCCIISLALSLAVLTGCSGNKEAEQTKANDRAVTERGLNTLKEYGRKPMERTRAAQELGEERTKAIDEAVRRQ